MPKATALIDADICAFNAAEWAQRTGANQIRAIDRALDMVERWSTAPNFGEADVICCLSSYPRWRGLIWSQYKADRPPPPPALALCIEAIRTHHEVATLPRMEADDVMGILATNGQYARPVIISTDKDMRQIPAALFNPDHPDRGIETTSVAEGERRFLMQWAMGDPGDRYPGIPGIGPKKASVLVDGTEDPVKAILDLYEARGFDAAYICQMAWLARILRASEWNFDLSSPILWDPY